MAKKNWIQSAVNPKHVGFCSPMTKSTCTPKRKAFAMTMKKHHGFHADGGQLMYNDGGNLFFMGGLTGAQAVEGGSGLAGELSGMINKKSELGGAASGAMKGASMGAALGPYGMAAGAVLGGVAGAISSKKAIQDEQYQDFTNSMSERNNLLGIKANGGFIIPSGVPNNTAYNYADGGLIKKSFNPDLAKSDIGFQSWYKKNTLEGQNNIPYSDNQTYDYLSFYKNKEHLNPDYNIDQHFPDTYKRPSHPTFSNESIYSTPERPGGSWKGESYSPHGKFQYADGGMLTEFNNGGSHETNPNQGVQQGISPNGEPNKVEQGETKYQDYIFSDRLKIDDQAVNDYNLPKTMAGKTFADASKKVSKLHKERPNDPISRDTMKSKMDGLMKANDEIRQYEEGSMMAMGGNLYKKGGPVKSELDTLMEKNVGYNPNANIQPEVQPNTVYNDKTYSATEENQMFGQDTPSKLWGIPDPATTAKTGSKIPSFLKDPKNLRYAPIAFDALAASGLFGQSPKPTQYSPTTITQSGYLAPQQMDEQSMRNAVDASYQTGAAGLSDASGGSGSALRAGLSGLNADYMSSIGKAYSGVNQANMAQKQSADQYNLGTQGNVASQNAQMQNQAGMYNNQLLNQNQAQNWDQRMSYLGKGAEGLGDVGSEARNSEILQRMYGYNQYGQYRPLNPTTAKACGGRLKMLRRKK